MPKYEAIIVYTSRQIALVEDIEAPNKREAARLAREGLAYLEITWTETERMGRIRVRYVKRTD